MSRSLPKHPCAASPRKHRAGKQSAAARTYTAPCPVLEGLFLVSQYRSASAVWENTSFLPPLQGKVQLRSLGSPAEESLGKAEVLLNILPPKPGWERPPKIPPSLRWTMDLRFLPLAEGRCLWEPFSVFRH